MKELWAPLTKVNNNAKTRIRATILLGCILVLKDMFGYKLHGMNSFVSNTCPKFTIKIKRQTCFASAIIYIVTLFLVVLTQYGWKKIPIALKKGCIIEDHNIGTKIMLYHSALYVPLLYLRFVTVTPCGDCAITKVVLIIILTLHIYGNIIVFKNEKRGDQEYYNHFRYWI